MDRTPDSDAEPDRKEAGGFLFGHDDAACRWISYDPPRGSGLGRQGHGAPPHLPKVALEDKSVSLHSVGVCRWEGPEEPENHVCVCQQREPEVLCTCWPGCTYAYGGVRRNVLVGVEVVEEVAIEDTVELITDHIYTDQARLHPPCVHLFQDCPDLNSSAV